MPRVRSGGAPVYQQPAHHSQVVAAEAERGFAGLNLGSGVGRSAADDAADSFEAGSAFRAYGHDARIFDLAFHPASSGLLVSASDDCTAGVWRRQAGAGPTSTGGAGGRYMQVAAFQGHADSVMRIAWSPDGKMVASGSSDGVVCLWQPREAALTSRHNLGHAGIRQLGSLEGHPEEVYACLFLSHTTDSSSSGGSGSAPCQPQAQAQAQPEAQPQAQAQAQRLVTASGESLFLWDLPTQQRLQQVPPPPVPDIATSVPERWRPGYLFGVAAQPDGPLLGAACSDGRLRLWARQGGDSSIEPLCTLPWNQAMGADCCFGPNGLFCAVSKDGAVIMMDVRHGSCLQHLQLESPLLSCTLLHNSSSSSSSGGSCGGGSGQCLVAAGADGGVHFVDVATGNVASLFPEAGPVRPLLCATLSADGACLAASGEAVLLGDSDLPAGSQVQPAGAGGAGTQAGHQPQPKWSPIHVWQRGTGRDTAQAFRLANAFEGGQQVGF